MTGFHQTLLGKQDNNETPMDPNMIRISPLLIIEQQLEQSRAFTDSEVKQVFFSIPNEKSPSPDR